MSTIPARLTLPRDDRPILIAALFIVAILIAGTAYTWERFGSAPLISPTYLLQQLQIGAFLGIVAAGMMLVILDLPDRPVDPVDADRRRDDGDHGRRARKLSRSGFPSASPSASSTASASPICACPR